MEYREIKCRNCGSAMRFEDGATKIKCEYCGMEYMLSGAKRQYNPVKTIGMNGRGILFKAYIPEDWNYRVTDDNSVSVQAAVCKGLRLDSPGGTQLLFFPFAYYKNYIPGRTVTGPGNFAKVSDYTLDGWSLVCWRRLVSPNQYVYERLTQIYGQLSDFSITQIEGQRLCRKLKNFPSEASERLGKPVSADAYNFSVSFAVNGNRYNGYFATAFAVTKEALHPEQQSAGSGFMNMFQNGMGMFGGMFGGMMNDNKVTSDWGRAFDVVLIAAASDKTDYSKVFYNFIDTIEYGPLYYALQDEEIRNVNSIQTQGAMTRQQNAIRASQNISRTLSETSDIVNSGCRERSERMDRMYDKYSQAVRGVDTYTDSYGQRYEADICYDHVYRYGDTFVGSKDGGLELGPEWEELRRE